MIFERLTLHNFQRYGGTNTIEFPDPEETSLVVILAPNNTGKTTILRAIDFLFYGSLGGEGSETSWKLVTDVIRDETQAGTEVKAWVEARLKFPDNQTLTVRRQITARRPTENKWMAESPKLLWRKTDSPNEKFQTDDGHYQVKIDNAVPQDLFSWFYFQGEPANGKMGRGATASVLEPLKKVLQIRRWKDARNNVQAVILSLTQQEAKEAGANKAFLDIRHRESVVRKSLETNRLDLNTLKTAEAELGRSKARLDTELSEVSSQAKGSQELYAQLSRETHYFGVATSGNTAWIDRENFLPSMHDRNNLVVTNPGGGEQQVFPLSLYQNSRFPNSVLLASTSERHHQLKCRRATCGEGNIPPKSSYADFAEISQPRALCGKVTKSLIKKFKVK